MKTAFFPGKFHPPHIGHIQTILNCIGDYSKIIVGVSEDIPKDNVVATPNEILCMLNDFFKSFDSVEICKIEGTLVESSDISYLPEFDVLLSGNERVIEWANNIGIKNRFVERSCNYLCSGTEIRKIMHDEDSYGVSLNFWMSKKKYPNYPNIMKRRLIDTNVVVEKLTNEKSITDIGCGEGSILLSLREFTELQTFEAYDLSEGLLHILIDKWGNYPGLFTYEKNLIDINRSITTDVSLALGSFPYIFNDNDLLKILSMIKSDVFIVRAPCTLNDKDEIINKFSVELGENYSAIYRTVSNYENLLSKYFFVHEVSRAYTDDIESIYGTKHYFFICRRR